MFEVRCDWISQRGHGRTARLPKPESVLARMSNSRLCHVASTSSDVPAPVPEAPLMRPSRRSPGLYCPLAFVAPAPAVERQAGERWVTRSRLGRLEAARCNPSGCQKVLFRGPIQEAVAVCQAACVGSKRLPVRAAGVRLRCVPGPPIARKRTSCVREVGVDRLADHIADPPVLLAAHCLMRSRDWRPGRPVALTTSGRRPDASARSGLSLTGSPLDGSSLRHGCIGQASR